MRIRLILSMLCVGASMVKAADAAAGKAVYERACKKCHGADGAGMPAIAKLMKVEMKHLASKEVQAKNDAALEKDITGGIGKMKGVTLAGGEAANLIAYLRTLKQ